jgi:hypothetical protein
MHHEPVIFTAFAQALMQISLSSMSDAGSNATLLRASARRVGSSVRVEKPMLRLADQAAWMNARGRAGKPSRPCAARYRRVYALTYPRAHRVNRIMG